MPTDNWVIEVAHLQKIFDDKLIIKDISLNVKRGEIFGFIGPKRLRKNDNHTHVVRFAHTVGRIRNLFRI